MPAPPQTPAQRRPAGSMKTPRADRVVCIMGIVFPSAAGGPMTAGSGYVLETLREGAEFTLYRGRQHGNPLPLLAVSPAAEQPSPQSLRRLEHEYLLAADLDPAWAARPLALTRHEGRAVLRATRTSWRGTVSRL